MLSVSMVALAGAALTFVAGLLAVLLGYRLVGRQPAADPANERRMVSVRRWFRLAGPLLMLFAVLLLVIEPPIPPPEWRTISSGDGACSVEMPGEPKEAERPAMQGLETPENLQILTQDRGETQYNLGASEVPAAYRDLPPEKLLETIGQNWIQAAPQAGQAQLVSERDLTDNGWPGREVILDIDGKRMQQKWFLVKDRLYRAVVSTPRDERHLADARRFLESFHVRKKPDADKGS